MGILNIGISALSAYQKQLATTGHNIANVNTEGYSRQRVDFHTSPAQNAGGIGFIGSGVDVSSIRRTYDDFLAGRVRDYNASEQEYEIFYQRSSQIDDVIADPAAGLDQMLQQFFASVHDVSADPTSLPARNVMINQSNILVDRFQSMDSWMSDLRSQGNLDFEQSVSEINGLGASIASVNNRLQTFSHNVTNPPNDLLDERDRLIDQLSGFVDVSTLTQDDGSLNVYIGTGQPLVVGQVANALTVTNNPLATDHKELSIAQAGGGTSLVTNQITGGRLGGLLRFRNEVLDPAQNSLGLVAIGLAHNFNEEHVTGMDLNGNLGGNFFKVASPDILANPLNSGSVTASFDDISNLNNHEYEFSFDGANWTMEDLVSNSVVTVSGAGTVANPFVADGMSLVIGAGAAAGDSYRLRPTRLGGTLINTVISDARSIAASESVRTSNTAGNTGTARIGPGAQVSSTGTTKLAAPITMTFNNVTNQFALSSGGTLNYNPATDSGNTLTASVAGLGDFSFEMTGVPANGDQFVLSDNTGGVGDNRNAQRLADLQNTSLLFGNTASLSDAYGYLVADVGTKTAQAASNSSVQNQLLTQAKNSQAAVSGVNLDEEAADLVRYQQAYQAAAQVISTANNLFDTLLGAVR